MDTTKSQEVLQDLKNVILSNKTISTQEKNNIKPRGLNQEVIYEYITKQKEIYPLGGVVLEKLIESIIHVPRDKIFDDLLIQSEKILANLSKKSEKRFYIVLTGHNHEGLWDPKKGGCHFKSNMYMAIVMMNMNPSLVEYFVDFVCSEKPIHGEYDPSVKNLVYIDDASFSGSQIVHSFNKIGKVLELDNHHIHIVILYVSPVAMNYISDNIPYENVELYTTETAPVPIKEMIPGIMNIPDLGEDVEHVKKLIALFLKGGLHIHHVRDIEKIIQKPLFYTDMKMADEHSTWPFIYFLPTLVDPSLKLIDFEKSLIKDCPYAGFMKATLLRYGGYCPVPTYKTKEWSDFITRFKF